MTTEQLNKQVAIPGSVRFDAGRGGLVFADLVTSEAEAHVYLHGAHLTHFQQRGQRSVLFVSEKSNFEPGKPIRGGVPVCWPWFAARGPEPTSPMHGFARTMQWDVEATSAGSITLVLRSSAETKKWWPGDFELRHKVTIGKSLKMELITKNTGREAFTIEEALHTYFAVSDIKQVTLAGLKGTSFHSKVKGRESGVQQEEPLRFAGETDSVYLNTEAACVISDPGWGRTIAVKKEGSQSTVVWNPWIERAKALPDFGDDEWPGMLCVETANTHGSGVKIEPGASHTMTAIIEPGR